MRRILVRLSLLLLAACVPSTPTSSITPPPVHATLAPRTLTPSPRPKRTLTPAITLTPTATLPTNIVVERGKLPPGFSLTVYAEVFGPTSLAFGPDGRLYIATTNSAVYAFADLDGDHRAEKRQTFAADVRIPLGIAWVGDKLYVSYNGSVIAVEDRNGDGAGDKLTPILTGLPADGRHQNDGLALGPDGYLYLGMGSTCDACRERDPRSAAMMRFKPDGSDLSVFATGLRNPYDLAFNAAGDLFATDNGRDDLGEAAPPEELNHIREGLDYGWPKCWEGAPAADCAGKTGAAAVFTARSSANGLAFYAGDNFPPEFKDNAFVAVLGSYELPELTRGVARVRLTKVGNAYLGQTEWFLVVEGRPLDVTVGPDGGLYVADYEQGMIYRIVYGAP